MVTQHLCSMEKWIRETKMFQANLRVMLDDDHLQQSMFVEKYLLGKKFARERDQCFDAMQIKSASRFTTGWPISVIRSN